jgi:hypothetical protein
LSDERVRVEFGFSGGQVVAAFVEPRSAEALESALGGGSGSAPVVVLDTEDGPLHVVVSKIAYYKRIVRAGRVGFSS